MCASFNINRELCTAHGANIPVDKGHLYALNYEIEISRLPHSVFYVNLTKFIEHSQFTITETETETGGKNGEY